MTSPTPPKPAGQTQTQASTKTADALAFVDQLETYVGGLKRELRAYGDPNTVGRDAQALRTFFGNIHQCEVQIAEAMGIAWDFSSS